MDSREMVALSHDDIERVGRFRIGDTVTVVQSDSKPWTADWSRTEAVVCGIHIGRHRTINISILHDGGDISDGFQPEDLAALRTAGTGRAEAEPFAAAAKVCHDEQMTIWSGEIAGALSMGGYLRDDLSYDDRIDVDRVIGREIRSIVESAFSHPELDRALPTQTAGGARGE